MGTSDTNVEGNPVALGCLRENFNQICFPQPAKWNHRMPLALRYQINSPATAKYMIEPIAIGMP